MSSERARFDRLYAEHLPAVLGYAMRRCEQHSDAADVTAETFLTLWRRLDDVPPGQERLWLFGVARRVLANQRRGTLRRSELAEHLRVELAACRPPSEPDERAQAVTDALARLPDRDRELLTLTAWDGLTPSEIGELEDIPAATVRSQLLRARTRLRRLIEPEQARQRA